MVTTARRGGVMCLLSIALHAWGAIPPLGAQAFDRRAWLDDYATLKHQLEQRYANLAWFASPEGGADLPSVDLRTRTLLQSVTTNDDARAAILAFVRAFHDGHFSQRAAEGAPAPDAPRAQPANPTYARDDAATGCAALNIVASDPPQFSLPFESLHGFTLFTNGIDTPFRSGVLEAGEGHARVGIVRIPAFEEQATFAACVAAWSRPEVWDSTGALGRGRLRGAIEASWYAALADILRRFQRSGVAAVAVDVGDNSGGDDSGDIAARLFTTKALRSAPMWLAQDSTAATPYFNEEIAALTDAQKRDPSAPAVTDELQRFVRERDNLRSPSCSLEWVWTEQRSWSGNSCRRLVPAGSAGGPLGYLAPRSMRDTVVARELHWPAAVAPLWGSWSGPLYVITDARTYSSAEMFAAVLRNNDAARTIGARTGGDGCGFVDYSGLVTLPHSGLRFRVPNCVRIRADGSDEVAGVSPDIPVLPRPGENGRTRALRLMQALTADVHPN